MWYAVSYVIFHVHDTNVGTHDIQINFLQTLLMANLWPFKSHIKQEFYDHIPEQCINVALSKLLLKVMPPNECEGKPLLHTVYHFIIQIKICAEYRDMLPRPRLVCQEPGLRPIGRSPGVPDKSSRGLGSMSRFSAQILICFIAYIFLIFFHSSVGMVGNFAGLPVCTVPSAIVHCNQNEAGHQTIKAPSMPCCSWPIKTFSGI